MEKNLKNNGRKPYQKPLIEQVELKPEEAVLTGCKVNINDPGQAEPVGTICGTGGKRCKDLGS